VIRLDDRPTAAPGLLRSEGADQLLIRSQRRRLIDGSVRVVVLKIIRVSTLVAERRSRDSATHSCSPYSSYKNSD